ncbi:major facilitator superfamily domain-containing protein [Aspergillus cavernicola]|uniref:Major facilitator superfamily domain-containing protein n=1 Tax=Aspergillus cavernicola TaxID=176166 RepID=A0ABR4IES8_9EURO
MQDLGKSLDMHTGIEVYLSIAIFILAYTIGPIFFGAPLVIYGCVRPLQLSNLWYLAWNLGCGFAQMKGQFFVFCFLVVRCSQLAMVLSERGKAMGVYTPGPLLGPVIGLIAGSFIAQYLTWRWVLWSTSAAAVGIQLVGFIYLCEYHPATLFRRRCN